APTRLLTTFVLPTRLTTFLLTTVLFLFTTLLTVVGRLIVMLVLPLLTLPELTTFFLLMWVAVTLPLLIGRLMTGRLLTLVTLPLLIGRLTFTGRLLMFVVGRLTTLVVGRLMLVGRLRRLFGRWTTLVGGLTWFCTGRFATAVEPGRKPPGRGAGRAAGAGEPIGGCAAATGGRGEAPPGSIPPGRGVGAGRGAG